MQIVLRSNLEAFDVASKHVRAWPKDAAAAAAAFAAVVILQDVRDITDAFHHVYWQDWSDQSKYLVSARAFAEGALDPRLHWYPLLYPLAVGALMWLPLFIAAAAVNLICFVLSYLGFREMCGAIRAFAALDASPVSGHDAGRSEPRHVLGRPLDDNAIVGVDLACTRGRLPCLRFVRAGPLGAATRLDRIAVGPDPAVSAHRYRRQRNTRPLRVDVRRTFARSLSQACRPGRRWNLSHRCLCLAASRRLWSGYHGLHEAFGGLRLRFRASRLESADAARRRRPVLSARGRDARAISLACARGRRTSRRGLSVRPALARAAARIASARLRHSVAGLRRPRSEQFLAAPSPALLQVADAADGAFRLRFRVVVSRAQGGVARFARGRPGGHFAALRRCRGFARRTGKAPDLRGSCSRAAGRDARAIDRQRSRRPASQSSGLPPGYRRRQTSLRRGVAARFRRRGAVVRFAARRRLARNGAEA